MGNPLRISSQYVTYHLLGVMESKRTDTHVILALSLDDINYCHIYEICDSMYTSQNSNSFANLNTLYIICTLLENTNIYFTIKERKNKESIVAPRIQNLSRVVSCRGADTNNKLFQPAKTLAAQ